jgi:uncharacterized protein (TIGR04141 family)
MNKVRLSIYLVKDGVDNADLFKKELEALGDDFICYEEKPTKTPKDVENFITTSHSNILDKLKTKSMSTAILKEVEIEENVSKKKFIITFGFGRSLINEEFIEKNFGLKTILNCAEQNSIKQISKKNISKNSKTSKEQMPLKSTFFEFDFDENGDILTEISAIIKQPYDFGTVTGKDSIHLKEKYNINNIDELLIILYEEYIKIGYKEKFPFIDKVQLERDKKIVVELDKIVLDKLKNKEYDKVFTAIPEIVEWESFDNIKFDYRKDKAIEIENSNKRDDIKVEDFFTNFDERKFDKIFASKIDLCKEDVLYKAFNFKKCLLGEIEYKNISYCLVNDNYYKIAKDYKKQIEEEYKNLATTKIDYLVDCNYKENEYITKLKQGDFLKLDCKLVEKNYKIEICDILEKNRLIHIKKYSGAASMSHFCRQAANSASLLKNDKIFIKEANEIIKKECAKANLNGNDYIFDNVFNANKYSIVFGIISKNGDIKPKISFFSKLNFVQTFKSLENIGFKCQITGIKELYETSNKDKT